VVDLAGGMSTYEPWLSLRAAVRGLVEPEDDPYGAADPMSARRVHALLWGIAALAGAVMLPFAPPVEAIGAAGWAIAGVFVAGALFAALRFADPERVVTFDHLLLASYAGLVMIGVLQWLTGGRGSPLQELYLLALISVVAVHAPRSALPFVLATNVALFVPFLYDGWDPDIALDVAANALLWSVLAIAVSGVMASIRSQRLRLRLGEEEAQRLARVDGLTGLGNRRALDETLEAEVARSARSGSPLSAAIVDMDGLKDINDRFGHLEGDDCLRQVAVTIRDTVRTADRCFRWAGDEFVVLLPDTPADEAKRVCGRVSTAVRRSCANSAGEPLRVTCGCSQYEGGSEAIDLLRAADLSLISKKRSKHRRNGPPRPADAGREAL
jgi:diguanylate cyclase (GGDEF)-like protein